MTDARPGLDASLPASVFLDHYWLKEELAAFCRMQGMSASGSKAELTARVAASLGGGSPPVAKPRRSPARMPAAFTLATMIEPGWRCSQDLRAFFSEQLGRPFRFDRFMREQIGGVGAGRTLGEVLDAWKTSIEAGAQTEIEPQFEYNRFVRAFRELRPDAQHQDVVSAWRHYRSMPASERPAVADLVCDLQGTP